MSHVKYIHLSLQNILAIKYIIIKMLGVQNQDACNNVVALIACKTKPKGFANNKNKNGQHSL